MHNRHQRPRPPIDCGPAPFVVDLARVARQNTNFRTTLWTGPHLQLTVMSIQPGEDIGLEQHNHLDQLLRIEDGIGLVMMGSRPERLNRQTVSSGHAVIVPAGTWHNIVNLGTRPLRVSSIYAPPNHPHGTVHSTKAIAEEQGD